MSTEEHECYIGIYHGYDSSDLITFNEIYEKEFLHYWNQEFGDLPEDAKENWKKYFDFRYSTALSRFIYCPYCGKKINWKELKGIFKND